MDNFRKHPKHRTGRSIDGFVGPKPTRQPNADGSGLHDFNQYYRPSRLEQPRLDNFKMPDGFTPTQNPGLPTPNQRGKATEISFSSDKTARLGTMASSELAPAAAGAAVPLTTSRRAQKKALKKSQRKHGKRRWLKVTLRTSAVMAVLLILVTGFIFGKAYWKLHHVLKGGGTSAAALADNVDPTRLRGEGDGRVNILMLGIGGPGHDGPDLTDTILVASIDPIQKQAALLSIPRDLYVKTPTGGSSKINAIYANAKYAVSNRAPKKTADVEAQAQKAGIEAIENTVTQTMGIPIHYYVVVDFAAFKQAVDTVGGVDINVTTALVDPTVAWENHNNPVIAPVGLDHMAGTQALLYARSRHGSARGDFDRTERQRQLLLALKTKVLSAGTFANPLKVSQLIDAFGNNVSTDLSTNDVMRLYDIGKGIDASKVASIGLADPPNEYVTTGASPDGQSIVLPKAGLYNYAAIQSYVRNTLRDSFLASENASVWVLNGTTTGGLATTKGNELKSFGYNVTKVDSAPTSTYTKTVLVDMTKGTKKYTKSYLEKRFNVTATTTLPDSSINATGADFVIILGTDAATSSSN